MPNLTLQHIKTRIKEDKTSEARLRKRTYSLPGTFVGLGAGAAAGAALGHKYGTLHYSKRNNAVAGALLGGAYGLGLGHLAGAAVERDPKRKNFSTMTSTTRTLVQFSAHLDRKLAQSGLVEFARDPRQEEESTLGKVGKVAAVGAGAAGLAAGGLYLRGRQGIAPGTLGVKDTILRGKNLIVGQDLPNAGRAVKAGVTGGMAAAKKATQRAYSGASTAATSGLGKIKARFGK